jgi:RhtB (resistance to homoserine/threonine) family protein
MPASGVEFLQVAVAHLLAVASPGPDFALVLRQSVAFGRRTAIWTSLGIGTAILVHVLYALLGLGLLLRGSEFWFGVVRYSGAGYLAWIGWQALRARPPAEGAGNAPAGPVKPAGRSAFVTGFLTNVLNPKATLFFMSLYALVVNPHTPKFVQAAYGIWMSLATAAWFCLVSVLFTHASVRRRFQRHGHWIDRALGVVLLGFAAMLALSTRR